MNRLCSRKTAKGSILIAALAVVAITAGIATVLLTRQAIEIKKTQQILIQDKLSGYARGIEAKAIGLLLEAAREREKGQAYDDLTQEWAQPILLSDTGDALVSGRIIDLQGFFNLNTLLFDEFRKTTSGAGSKALPRELEEQYHPVTVFERLVESMHTGSGEAFPAQTNSYYLLDWLSSQITGTDEEYTEQENGYAYRPAKRAMVSVSELRLVKSITSGLMISLMPFVTAFPVAPSAEEEVEMLSKININTASPVVLAALLDVTQDRVLALTATRPYITMQSVTDEIKKMGAPMIPPKVLSAWLDIKSDYFLIESKAVMGAYEATWYTMVYRSEENEVEILYRMRGVY